MKRTMGKIMLVVGILGLFCGFAQSVGWVAALSVGGLIAYVVVTVSLLFSDD